MRLIIETGQGIPEANSYIAEDDAMNWLPSTLMEDWNSLTPDEQVDHLIAASQFIDASFQWIGTIKSLDQGLSWPRVGVSFQGHEIPADSVPRAVRRASLMSLSILLVEGFDTFQSIGDLLIKRERLAAIETEYFAPPEGDMAYKSSYEDINNVLKGFYAAKPSGGVIVAGVLRT